MSKPLSYMGPKDGHITIDVALQIYSAPTHYIPQYFLHTSLGNFFFISTHQVTILCDTYHADQRQENIDLRTSYPG